MKSIAVITTVGTSLITNFLDNPNKAVSVAKKYLETKPYFDKDRTTDDNDEIDANKTTIKNNLKQYSNCAEISTLDAIKAANINEIIKVYLICTDTVLSPLCAQLIKNQLLSKGFDVAFEAEFIIEGLRITGADAKERFETIGFENLLSTIDKIYDSSEWIDEKTKSLGKNMLLNITGGYKALIPFLTIYGQLQGVHLNYLYEDSQKLIEIEDLPLNFDWAVMEGLRPYLSEEINKNDLGNKSQTVIDKLKKLHFIKEEKDKYVVIALGKLLITKFHESNLKNNILGTFLEYKYLEYFLDIDNTTRTSIKKYEIGYSYRYQDDTFDLDFSSNKAKKYLLASKSGDIDLLLQKSEIIIEAKNFHTAQKYKNKIGKHKKEKGDEVEEDYYKQIKAKIEAYHHIEKKYPTKFLFLVNAVLFVGDKKDYHTDTELIESLSYFKAMIFKDYQNKIEFEAQLCKFNFIKEDNLKVNYSGLLTTKIKANDFKQIPLK